MDVISKSEHKKQKLKAKAGIVAENTINPSIADKIL